jgi:cysteine desulfurase
MTEIYLDNSATTMVAPQVADRMHEVMTSYYGNPSSMHSKGVEAERLIREASRTLAGILKCNEKQIIYTAGGTGADNLAILGAARAKARSGKHLITTKIEHPAVLQSMKCLEDEGFTVTCLDVDACGHISLDALSEAITPETTLVSIMHTNNEIGALQDLSAIGELIKSRNPQTLFHVDAVQGFGKTVILPKRLHIDLLSASGHKIHGPKGVGFLYVGEGVRLLPISYGGGQQGGIQNGTENVPGIVGMAMAAGLLYEHLEEDTERLYDLKVRLIRGVADLTGVHVNGLIPVGERSLPEDRCVTVRDEKLTVLGTAPHVISVSFAGVRSEVLLHTLEEDGIYVSAGSACSTHKKATSATLTAIGLNESLAESTLRFSTSVYTTPEEIDATINAIRTKLPVLQRYTRN